MNSELFYGLSITEIIKKRLSVRTYLEQPLTPEIKEKLLGFFSILRGPFGGTLRINLIENDLARKGSNAKLGTNKIHFYLQHTKGYAKALAYDLQRVDMGIAMCHFELTAREQGIDGKWQVSDPGSISTPQATEYVVSWVNGI